MRARGLLLLCGIVFGGVGCGYLDRDMFIDDEQFEEELEMLHGSGWSEAHVFGCGGFGYYRRTSRSSALHVASTTAPAEMVELTLSDEEILASTDVEMIDETTAVAAPGLVEAIYYEQKAARDRSIARVY